MSERYGETRIHDVRAAIPFRLAGGKGMVWCAHYSFAITRGEDEIDGDAAGRRCLVAPGPLGADRCRVKQKACGRLASL